MQFVELHRFDAAASTIEAFGREFDREAVLQSLLRMFSVRYEALPASPVADYARARYARQARAAERRR